jgi:hypothetical protein
MGDDIRDTLKDNSRLKQFCTAVLHHQKKTVTYSLRRNEEFSHPLNFYRLVMYLLHRRGQVSGGWHYLWVCNLGHKISTSQELYYITFRQKFGSDHTGTLTFVEELICLMALQI